MQNSNMQNFTMLPLLTAGRLLCIVVAAITLGSCAKTDKPADEKAATQEQTVAKPQYYKVKEVKLGAVDEKMAHAGGKIFDVTCTSCHKYDERYVGPALREVTKRRTPEFVINMILDTETMVENDDTVKCMLQTYLLKMPNMQVNEQDARSVLEHLRVVADKPADKPAAK
jgi:hypothetical protein